MSHRVGLRTYFNALLLALTVAISSPVPGACLVVISSNELQRREDREEALQLKLDRKVNKSDKIVRVGSGRFVETALERTERIFVVLVEYQDVPHNQLPQPDRNVDPFTPWKPNFNRAHYQDLVFHQMRRYFEAQSGGRYSISGHVTDWVTMPAGLHYRIDPTQAIAAWIEAQVQSGQDRAAVIEFLRTFDRHDPFDTNDNGVFDEPDGVLDTVILVEAGGLFASIGAFPTALGDEDLQFFRQPIPIGDTGLMLGAHFYADEAAPLGLFAHEYGHLLGLPDEYRLGIAVGSPTGHWTLMSSHWIFGDSNPPGGLSGVISMSAWDKLQLGWLNYEVTTPDKRGAYTLGAAAAAANTKTPQALVVNLPLALNPSSIATSPIVPPSGLAFWWARGVLGSASSMTRTLRVPAGNPMLTLKLWRDAMGPGLDYTYVSVSTDGGLTWSNLASPGVTTNENPHGFNEGNGITGTSGAGPSTWLALPSVITASFDLTPYARARTLLRIRDQRNRPHQSWVDEMLHFYCGGCPLDELLDGGSLDDLFRVNADADLVGLAVDDIAIGAWSDGAEAVDGGWILEGFVVRSNKRPHYYVAEYRHRTGTDAALADRFPKLWAPANFPPDVLGARFGYDPGLLVWYRNRTFPVNRPRSGSGGLGLGLVDAHPAADLGASGQPFHNQTQLRDAAFSLNPTTPETFYEFPTGAPSSFASLAPEPVFDDSRSYSSPYPGVGLVLPVTGTRIEVINTNMHDAFMHIITGPR